MANEARVGEPIIRNTLAQSVPQLSDRGFAIWRMVSASLFARQVGLAPIARITLLWHTPPRHGMSHPAPR
jgi:hypothetical protein